MTSLIQYQTNIVESKIRHLKNDSKTQSIFLLWPNLTLITERFCNLISPLVPGPNGISLIDYSIENAVSSYREEQDIEHKVKSYILSLIDSACYLNELSISGITDECIIKWEHFIEPMSYWIEKNKINALTISNHKSYFSTKAAKLSILVHILTAEEICEMNLISADLSL